MFMRTERVVGWLRLLGPGDRDIVVFMDCALPTHPPQLVTRGHTLEGCNYVDTQSDCLNGLDIETHRISILLTLEVIEGK